MASPPVREGEVLLGPRPALLEFGERHLIALLPEFFIYLLVRIPEFPPHLTIMLAAVCVDRIPELFLPLGRSQQRIIHHGSGSILRGGTDRITRGDPRAQVSHGAHEL